MAVVVGPGITIGAGVALTRGPLEPLVIPTNDGGGLTGWGSTALAVAYNPVIISTYGVGSTITFYDNTTATVTGIDNYGPLYIDIFWNTPKTGTLFPITLSI